MATENDDLVLSISADTRQILNAMKRLTGEIEKSTNGIQKQFDSVGRGIDKSMTTAMQKRIDAMVGLGANATKEWTGALAQQGKELERLRAKFSPVFSTINSYKSSINEIRTAHRLGAISSEEMTAAIQRERQAALSSIAAIKQRNAAISDTPVMRGASGGSSFNTSNLAAQGFDVMATAGSMPFYTVALQQGPQVAQVFNDIRSRGEAIGPAVAGAFAQILNPVSLVTIGVIGATAAAVQYFVTSEDGAEKTAKSLKDQAELIQRVAQKWGDALPAIREYANEQDRLAGTKDIKESFKGRYADTFKEIGVEVTAAGDAIQDVMDLLRNSVPPEQIVAVQRALAVLTDTAKENKTTVADMDAAHKALTDAFRSESVPALQAAADTIADLTPKLEKVREAMAVQASQEQLGLLLEDLQAKIGTIDSANARKELQDLFDRMKEGDVAASELQMALARISGYAPDVSSIISAFLGVARAATAARDAASTFTGKESQGGRVRYGELNLPDTVSTVPEARVDPYFDDPIKKTRGSGGRKKTDTAANAYRDLVKSANDRIEQMKLEMQLVGVTGAASDALRMKLELLQKATDKGRTIDDKKRAELEKLAETYGKVAEMVAGLKVQQDLLYERQQMFRSPTEQRVNDQLRSAGIDISSTQGQTIAGQIRLNEQLALSRDLTLDFASSFVNDLKSGVSVMDALSKAAQRLGDQLIDMGLQQGVNSLFGNIAGAIGGGFTSTPNGFANMLGLPGHASGTANTGGARGQVRGIVHGQEAVIPLPNGGFVPVKIQAPQMPDFVQPRSVGGDVHASYSPIIDMRGASIEAVDRLERVLAKDKADFSAKVIRTVQEAQKSRLLN